MNIVRYDKRTDGSHGLAVFPPGFPELGILPYMRVEPSRFLPDVNDFFSISAFPFPVLFWNLNLQTIAKHRNPLLAREIHTGLCRTMTIDALHCLYLGLFIFTTHINRQPLTIGSGSEVTLYND